LQGQADCGSNCLATLNFDNLQITSVDAGAFDTTGLSHVTKLTMAGNLFTSLPESVFDKMTGLRTLDLSENGLTSVHSALFDKLTFMYRLYLNQNQLQILSLGVFDQLTGLNYV
jgi:Leucine-rich repeat (LRR) protein